MTFMARRTPWAKSRSGVLKRSSLSRWFEITGLPVRSAKPQGEARSAPTLAVPIRPSFQPPPARSKSPYFSRNILQDVTELRFSPLRRTTDGLVEQLRESIALARLGTEFGHKFLLANAQLQRTIAGLHSTVRVWRSFYNWLRGTARGGHRLLRSAEGRTE